MGTAGIMPSTIALFVLWMLTTVPAISARSHRCKYNEIKTTTATDLCSNFIERFKEGYDLNRESMPANVDLSNATDCQYIKRKQKAVVGCCLGWSGPACDKPECGGCDQGQCIELQGSGVPASAPPYCRCFDGFGGKKCDEDLSQLKKSTQYCFEDSNCEGKKTSPDVMARSKCCSDGSGSWGSSTLSECTPCESTNAEANETMTVELDRVTCMTAGEDIFRTFDDARFTYYSTCTIALLRSTNGLEVYTQTVCDADNKCNCKKVVTVNYVKNSKKYSLVVNDDSITATGPEGTDNIPITEEKGSIGNNIVFKRDSESVYFWFLNEDLSFRRDDSGLFMLTIKKTSPLLGTISGICGDFDGRSDNDQANLDTLFEQNTNAEAPCGNGFTECPASMVDEASSACDYLRGNLFRSCLIKGVDSTPYYDLCMRAYCTANKNGQDKADLARCNVLEMFAHTCYKQANVAIRWRSQDFCPKS